jgi:hypothetical protein
MYLFEQKLRSIFDKLFCSLIKKRNGGKTGGHLYYFCILRGRTIFLALMPTKEELING